MKCSGSLISLFYIISQTSEAISVKFPDDELLGTSLDGVKSDCNYAHSPYNSYDENHEMRECQDRNPTYRMILWTKVMCCPFNFTSLISWNTNKLRRRITVMTK